MTKFTVQCGYAAYYSRTQTVEADTLDEALDAAITDANAHDDWVSEDVSSSTFIDAVAEGDDVDLWSDNVRQLGIPARFTERGEGPRVIIIVKNNRVESVAIGGGYARVELRDYDHGKDNSQAQTDAEGRRYALTDWSNVIPPKAE